MMGAGRMDDRRHWFRGVPEPLVRMPHGASDYDPEGAEWISCRTIGMTAHDQQMDTRSIDHYRHCEMSVDGGIRGPWKKGRVPPARRPLHELVRVLAQVAQPMGCEVVWPTQTDRSMNMIRVILPSREVVSITGEAVDDGEATITAILHGFISGHG